MFKLLGLASGSRHRWPPITHVHAENSPERSITECSGDGDRETRKVSCCPAVTVLCNAQWCVKPNGLKTSPKMLHWKSKGIAILWNRQQTRRTMGVNRGKKLARRLRNRPSGCLPLWALRLIRIAWDRWLPFPAATLCVCLPFRPYMTIHYRSLSLGGDLVAPTTSRGPPACLWAVNQLWR